MPYKRNYGKRRRNNKKSTAWYDKKYSTADLAMKAFKGVKALKGIINSELKLHEINDNSNFCTQAGSVSYISGIGQGDLQSQRNGNSVLAKMLYLKYRCIFQTSITGSICKVYLIKDNQQIADTVPTFADVFGPPTTELVQAFPNWDTRKRFQIKDVKQFTQDQNIQQHLLEFSIPLESHIIFNGTSSNDSQKGHYYLLFVSNKSSNVPEVRYSSRITFYDN